MGSTLNLLHDTHVLILMDDPLMRSSIVDLFQSMDAKVHCAENQATAIGM
jgi:CheY-like chemotaxis protein